MRVRSVAHLIVVLFLIRIPAFAQTECSGSVTGPGGKRLPLAHVTILNASGGSLLTVVQATKEGAYTLVVPHLGFWLLRFTGVGYAECLVTLYVPSNDPIELSVSLGSHYYVRGDMSLTVIGDFNLWSIGKAVPLKKGRDGNYSAVIAAKSDSVTFRVRGYRDADGVEGIRNATYLLNGKGSYDARIKASAGRARITVDPRLLDRTGTRAIVSFGKASRQTREIAHAVREWRDADIDYFAAQLDVAMHRTPLNSSVKSWAAYMATVLKQGDAEPDSLVASVWALGYVSMAVKAQHRDPEILTRCLDRLSGISPVWGINPLPLATAVRLSTWPVEKKDEYIQTAIWSNPDREVRAAILSSEFVLAFNKDENAKASRYYELIQKEYADTPQGAEVLRTYPRPEAK